MKHAFVLLTIYNCKLAKKFPDYYKMVMLRLLLEVDCFFKRRIGRTSERQQRAFCFVSNFYNLMRYAGEDINCGITAKIRGLAVLELIG
jgi:hypothetical protein